MDEVIAKELIEQIKILNKRISRINKEVFNADEAAEYLRIGYGTILSLTRIGEIEHVKNGTNYIYKKEYLDSWLEKNKVRAI